MSDGVPAQYLAEPGRYFLEWIPSLLAQSADARRKLEKVDAVAQFDLTGAEGGRWYFELKKSGVKIDAGSHPKPSFTLAMDVDIWRQLNRGELNGLKAYMRGDIALTGSKLKFFQVARLF